jgi:hypothetical protein
MEESFNIDEWPTTNTSLLQKLSSTLKHIITVFDYYRPLLHTLCDAGIIVHLSLHSPLSLFYLFINIWIKHVNIVTFYIHVLLEVYLISIFVT